MKAAVVETNVLVVANQKASHASPDCILACINILESLRRRTIIVIDNNWHIFKEYNRYACMSGQPGAGDFFFKWLYQNQCVDTHCEQVAITPRTHDSNDFLEFPSTPDLNSFDRADRKFAAVALTSSKKPTVINATDSDWWLFRRALRKHGLKIKFLCPEIKSK